MLLISEEHSEAIRTAISLAELQTSGEIRVFVETECPQETESRAWECFHEMGMLNTVNRNACLIYVALESHVFCILGDEGIHKIVGQDFWDTAKNKMSSCFSAGDIVGGITSGIHEVGLALKSHFPLSDNDQNELPNDVVYGK
jgi:uncharacterized membrane protein